MSDLCKINSLYFHNSCHTQKGNKTKQNKTKSPESVFFAKVMKKSAVL